MRNLYHQSRIISAFIIISVLVLTLSSVLSSAPALADGDNELNTSYRYALFGNFIAGGVGLRGTGEGSIVITDIPDGASIFRAYLYWGTIGSANTYTSPVFSSAASGAHNVQGELIGTSGDTCWGAQNNFTYRADVTSWVGGNGIFTISGLPASLENGNDSQGASLVIIYRDVNEPYRTIILHDGAVTLDLDTNVYTDTFAGYTVDSPVTDAQITYIVGDGQPEWDANRITFNDIPIATQPFQGSDGNYWGTLNFNVTDFTPTAPSTTRIDNFDPDSPTSPDCLVWVGTIFSVTSPTPPPEDNLLLPAFVYRLHGDVTSDGVGLRGTGEGIITISGIPVGSLVHKAYLYWATLGNSSAFTNPTLNGERVEGEVIGVTGDTCWGVEHNYTYRADVTSFVSGNGQYSIAGLPDSLERGNDSQGASLVILYTTSINRPFRTIIINDGAVALDLVATQYTDVITRFIPDDPVREAHVTYLIGDGQSIWDTGAVTFEGETIARNVFTGVDGDHWGTLTFDVSYLSPSDPASTTIRNNVPGSTESPDCLLWAATIFSVTAPQPEYTERIFFPLTLR